jgi:hypothetical protein
MELIIIILHHLPSFEDSPFFQIKAILEENGNNQEMQDD